MTRVLASSVETLDAATTITSQIDAVLMGQEGLDIDPEISWVPGDPLHVHPHSLRVHIQERLDELEEAGEWDAYEELQESTNDGPDGNHVRPMFEIIGLRETHRGEIYFASDDTLESFDADRAEYCNDCEVVGDRRESECWLCGKTYLKKKLLPKVEVTYNADGFVTAIESFQTYLLDMIVATDTAADAFREMRERQLQAYSALFTNPNFEFRRHQMISYPRRAGGYHFIDFETGVTPDPQERSYVNVPQERVEAIQELPELIRGSEVRCDIPRPSRSVFERISGTSQGFDFWSNSTSIEIPNEIPTAQPPLPVAEPVAVPDSQEPAYVRLMQDLSRRRNIRN